MDLEWIQKRGFYSFFFVVKLRRSILYRLCFLLVVDAEEALVNVSVLAIVIRHGS